MMRSVLYRIRWGWVLGIALLLAQGCSEDDPAGPGGSAYSLVSTTDLPANGRKAVIDGSYLYVACEDSGLVVLDVSSPEAVKQVARLDFSRMAYHVAIEGTTAYVTLSHDGGLATVDVSNPLAPQVLDSIDLPTSQAERTCVSSGLAVTANGDSLALLDVSDPGRITSLGFVAHLGGHDARFCPASVGADLLVAADTTDLVSFDISDPTLPLELSRLSMPDLVYGFCIEGSIIAVADRYEGLSFVSVDGSGTLTLISSLALSDADARDVSILGTRAFVASSEGSVAYVVDLSTIAQPSVLWDFQAGEGSKGLAVDASHIYVLHGAHLSVISYGG